MSIVEPYLQCCCTLYGRCAEEDFKQLHIIQNCAARIEINKAYDAHSLLRIKSLSYPTVRELTEFETGNFSSNL